MHYFYRIHGLILKVNFMIFYLDEIKDESIINNDELVEVIETKNIKKYFPKENNWDTSFIKFFKNECILIVNNIVTFYLKDGAYIYWERSDDQVSQKDIINFLITSAINIAAIQKGKLILNATTLFKKESVITLIGPPCIGKNTIALMLFDRGWQIISNEASFLSDDQLVFSGNRNLRIWKDTAITFGIKRNKLQNIRSNLKRYQFKYKKINLLKPSFKLNKVYFVKGRYQPNMDFLKEKRSPIEKNKIGLTNIYSEQLIMMKLRNNIFNPRFYRGLNKEEGMIDSLFVNLNKLKFHELQFPDNLKMTKRLIDKSSFFEKK